MNGLGQLAVFQSASTTGFVSASGLGSNYTILPGDSAALLTALSGGSEFSIQVSLHLAGNGGFPFGTGLVAADGFQIVPGQMTIPLSAFIIGGTIAPGSIIDGYQLTVSNGEFRNYAKEFSIDNLRIGTPAASSVPEPSALWLAAAGVALLGAVHKQKS